MTAKQYLQQVKTLDAKINVLLRRKDEILRSYLSLGGTDPTKEKVSGGAAGNASYTRLVENLLTTETEIDANINELQRLKLEITGEISLLESAEQIDVLCRRYVDCQTWSEIARAMHYSDRAVFKIHAQALDAFEKICKRVQ